MSKVTLAFSSLVLLVAFANSADEINPINEITNRFGIQEAFNTYADDDHNYRLVDMDIYQLIIDCARRSAVVFYYKTESDSGDVDKIKDFYQLPNEILPVNCQQKTTTTYGKQTDIPPYQRGHLVPANHFDGSAAKMKLTNYMVNVLPQTRTLNTGAWKQTEVMIECLRDETTLSVWGGPLWGNNITNDAFLSTHGIETPDAFWKVVYDHDNHRAIGFLIPNSVNAKGNIKPFIRRVSYIEQLVSLDLVEDSQIDSVLHLNKWKQNGRCKQN